MQNLATEIDAQEACAKMADAIDRIEAAIAHLASKEAAKKQVITELDSYIDKLEKILGNTKET